MKQELIQKIENRTAIVGVVGLGYVGLPFAVETAKEGFQVIGIDRNAKRCDMVNRGENYIGDVDDAELKELAAAGKITAMTSYDRVPEMDCIIIAVPTPLDTHLNPDLQYVEKVTGDLAPHIKKGQFISLESTTYPGTTEEVMLPILEESGLKAETDFYLAHSPERVDPGNRKFNTKNTNKVVGGVGPDSLEVAISLYSATIDTVVPVSTAKAAELTKVFENTFRAVNIALVNELTKLCDRMDINVWEVLEAANTKPFGIMRFMPGPGVGGHCIPLDPHYLEWKAREYNFRTKFIGLAGEINRSMPEFVREKVNRLLNEHKKPLNGSKILALGVSYKKDIDDWRESPSLPVMELLIEAGADVVYHDPHVADFKEGHLDMKSVDLTEEALKSSDLVLILTDHSAFDYEMIAQHASAILDTRNATQNLKTNRDKVTLL